MAPLVRLSVDLQLRVRTWAPPRTHIAAWASMALGRQGAGRELGVRVVGPAESRRLNARYRGRNRPTNVLSFPAPRLPEGPQQPLGDLVICPAVLRAEAHAQRKSLRAHWAHLVVHGTLHLIGYDHERPAQASRMERREVALLRRLGFPDPYRSA
ncbi:MAG TPA: rRNA maturation RNase YbeY [Steroidobacteraceae bacterium]|nr:rRNA maturation RNase YbeY [Steroidobacteraceae bacterium]